MSDDGMYLYHLGIIDYLQDYNLNKKGENFFKSMVSDGTLISAVHPKPYAERYYKFMQEFVIINQRNGKPTPLELDVKAKLKEMLKKQQDDIVDFERKQHQEELEYKQHIEEKGHIKRYESIKLSVNDSIVDFEFNANLKSQKTSLARVDSDD